MSTPVLDSEWESKKLITNGDNSITIPDVIVPALSDLYIAVGVHINSRATGAVQVLSGSRDGQSFVKVGALDSGDVRTEVWELIAPNTGTSDIVFTITDPVGVTRATVLNAQVWHTVNQDTPIPINRGITKQGSSGDATVSILSFSEEVVLAFGAFQVDHGALTVSGQLDRTDLTQAGDTTDESVRGISGYKTGEASTLVGWEDEAGGTWKEFSMFGLPLTGPKVTLEATGSWDWSSATAALTRDIPLSAILSATAISSALLGAKNWLSSLVSATATATASLTRNKLISSILSATAIVGNRTGRGPRLWVVNSQMLTASFAVELANYGVAETGPNFQDSEHGVRLTATVKLNDADLDITGATILLYVDGNEFSPFPMSPVVGGPTNAAEYIVGRHDFPAGVVNAQVDVLLPSGNQYRSGSVPVNVVAVVV